MSRTPEPNAAGYLVLIAFAVTGTYALVSWWKERKQQAKVAKASEK